MDDKVFKKSYFFLIFRHLYKRFSKPVLYQKSKVLPPFDSKFSVDFENGVIFEKKQSRSRDIPRYVKHGEIGSDLTYRPQRVRQGL